MENLTVKTSKKKKKKENSKLSRIPILPRIISDRSEYPETFPAISNPTQQDRPVLARFFNGAVLSVLTVETLPVHRLHCGKFPGNAIAGFEIYMYEPSTRSRDVYTCIYIRKQWHNRDGCIGIEKRHVIKCCPKVIDMKVNGKNVKNCRRRSTSFIS